MWILLHDLTTEASLLRARCAPSVSSPPLVHLSLITILTRFAVQYEVSPSSSTVCSIFQSTFTLIIWFSWVFLVRCVVFLELKTPVYVPPSGSSITHLGFFLVLMRLAPARTLLRQLFVLVMRRGFVRFSAWVMICEALASTYNFVMLRTLCRRTLPPSTSFLFSMARLLPFLPLTFLAASAFGRVFNSYGELKGLSAYDFVIVGAGAGGAAMANRLTETNASVLLVEAGGA